MFEFHGVWLPDGEEHLPEWMQKKGIHVRNHFPTYQYHKYKIALRWTKQRRHAVDIGAFVGQWSRVMAMDFERVTAFEPVQTYRECWYRNMKDVGHAEVIPVALGAASGSVSMINVTPGSFGNTHVSRGEEGEEMGTAAMTCLDTYALPDVDLVKIDCEGFELHVLEGAARVLEQKPCIIVEQKHNKDAVPFLESRGAILRSKLAGDYIFSWD